MSKDIFSEPKKRGLKIVPIEGERLERRLVIAFGFMSVIPILFIFWATVNKVNGRTTLLLTIASALFGYFFVARRMIQSVLNVTERVKGLTSGQATGPLEVPDTNENG